MEEGFSDREKPLFTSNAMILKEQVLWKGPWGRLCWRFRSAESSWGAGTGLGQPTPGNPGKVGSGGGRACDLRAPPRHRQLAWGWGVTVSSPCRHRRRAAVAAIREVQDGFLLPAQSRQWSEAGSTPVLCFPFPSRRHSWPLGAPPTHPGVRQKRPPLGPGRQSSGGAGGAARCPAPARWRGRAGGGEGEVSLNSGREGS